MDVRWCTIGFFGRARVTSTAREVRTSTINFVCYEYYARLRHVTCKDFMRHRQNGRARRVKIRVGKVITHSDYRDDIMFARRVVRWPVVLVCGNEVEGSLLRRLDVGR